MLRRVVGDVNGSFDFGPIHTKKGLSEHDTAGNIFGKIVGTDGLLWGRFAPRFRVVVAEHFFEDFEQILVTAGQRQRDCDRQVEFDEII